MNDLKIILKRKNIQLMVDFCLDESVEFTLKPQQFPDTDWEMTIKIVEVKTALIAGMFLRENRIEVNGIDQQKMKKPAAPKKTKEETEDKAEDKQEKSDPTPEITESNTIF